MDTTKIVEKIKYGDVELKLKPTTLQSKTVSPNTEPQTVLPDEEYGGLSSVIIDGVTSAVDENIIPANIRKGKNILGVEGILEPDRPDQNKTIIPTKQPQAVYADPGYELAEVIVEGVTSSVDENILATNIKKGVSILGVEGSLEPNKPDQSKVVKPSVDEQIVRADTGYALASVTVEGVTSDVDENIQADNIRYGVEILGVVGSMEQKEDLDAELNEQDALLAELENSVNELSDKLDLSETTAIAEDVREGKEFFNASGEKVVGTYKDMLQARVDSVNSCSYLLYNYRGGSVDFIKTLDTSNVTNMEHMFEYCSVIQTIPLLDTSKVSAMNYMFKSCSNLQTIPLLNTSNVTEMNSMFEYCSIIQTIPLLNTSNVTRMEKMFQYCPKLQTIPLLDTSKVSTMENMFANCSELQTVTLLNTSNLRNVTAMFGNCSKLQTVQLNTSNVTAMSYMFNNCSNLQTIPLLDTNNVTTMSYMFSGCSGLQTVTLLNMNKVTNTSGMFNNCKKLTNLTLKNIKKTLQIGATTSWGTLLTDNSIVNIFQELWDLTGSTAQTLTLSTPSNARTEVIYVKLIDVTDEMRAEDEYIDNKKPCVVCESTDEGAMTLKEYGISKNWNIA